MTVLNLSTRSSELEACQVQDALFINPLVQVLSEQPECDRSLKMFVALLA